jgi:hypothetical protein
MVQPVLYDLVDSAQQRLFGGRLRGFFDSKLGLFFVDGISMLIS